MAKRATKKKAVTGTVDMAVTMLKDAPAIERPRSVPETVVLLTAVILLTVLGYTILPILSPFVLVGSIVYLLFPLRESLLAKRIMWLSIILFVLWFFYSILGLLAPFIIALLVAYILNPVVSSLAQKGVPRWVSSLVTVLLLIGIVVAFVLFVMPIALHQFRGIIAGVNVIAKDFAELLKTGTIFDVLEGYGLPVDRARETITEHVTPRLENVLMHLFEGVFGFITGISSLVLQLINAVIIPFLIFYILMDFPTIMHRFAMLVPSHRRERFIESAKKTDALLGRYIRGAITVAIIQGTIAALGLWLIGVRYSLVLGIMTGILNFIPYVGLITSLVVSSIVALFSGEPILAKVIGVTVLFLSQKLLEATVLAPKIIGSQVGLHPVLLILCLLVFGYFLGFIGLLIAVPATALIIAAVKEWEARRDAAEA
jgi:predicted PurR-regulated permease PerM